MTEYTIPNKVCAECGRVILPTENFSYVTDKGPRCTGCSNAPVSLTWSVPPTTNVIMPALKEEGVAEERPTVQTSFTVTRELKRKRGANHQVHYDSRTKQLEIRYPMMGRTIVQIPREDLAKLLVTLGSVLDEIAKAEVNLLEGKAP